MFNNNKYDFNEKLIKFVLNDLLSISDKILTKSYYENLVKKNLLVKMKSDLTPVTQIDLEVEKKIKEKILKKFPTHAIYGEELESSVKFSDDQSVLKNKYLWIIDPIDGTKSFITGSPLFGTLIAVLFNEEVILGAVNLPILKQKFWGLKNKQSSTKNRMGTFIVENLMKAKSTPPLNKAILQTTTPDLFINEKEKNVFETLKRSVGMVRYGGDCFCYTALFNGGVDIVIEADLACYDFMAYIPIIEGAGGCISNWEGNYPTFNKNKERILVTRDLKLHNEILDLIN